MPGTLELGMRAAARAERREQARMLLAFALLRGERVVLACATREEADREMAAVRRIVERWTERPA